MNSRKNYQELKKKSQLHPHYCRHCRKVFSNVDSLKRHARRHNKQRYPLRGHNLKRLSSEELLQDVIDLEDEQYFKCDLCNQQFLSKYGLAGHLASHVPKPLPNFTPTIDALGSKKSSNIHEESTTTRFMCRYCPKTFSKHFIKIAHEEFHFVKRHRKSYKCRHCHKSFTAKAASRLHRKLHIKKKIYKCNVCTFSSATRKKLVDHKKRHLPERTFKCETCLTVFASKFKLSKHMLMHLKKKLFKCKFCKKAFRKKKTLVSHEEDCENGGECTLANGHTLPTCTLVESSDWHRTQHNGDTLHTCDDCGKCFSHKSSLDSHKKTHVKQSEMPSDVSVNQPKVIECDECQLSFSTTAALKDHFIHTGTTTKCKQFQCPLCKKCYARFGDLRKHACPQKTQHTQIKPVAKEKHHRSCEQSSKKEALINHKKMHLAEREFKCEKCQKVFASKFQLSKHMLIHLFKCKFCKKAFRQKMTLVSHEGGCHGGESALMNGQTLPKSILVEPSDSHRTQHKINGDTLHTCDDCGKCFSHKSSLDSHKKTHVKQLEMPNDVSVNQVIECDECHLSFSTTTALKNHLIQKGKITECKQFKCPVCEKCYARLGDLRKHACPPKQDTHIKPVIRDKRQHFCDQCGKSYSRKGDLTRHTLTHTGVKPYVCQHCGMSFTRKSFLNRHENKHTGIKVYKCQYCEETFAGTDDLRYHEQKHKQQTKYKCKQCGKEFASSAALNFHQKSVHFTEKAYHCVFCPKTFVQQGDLTVHERIHTGKKPFQCLHSGCDAAFLSKTHLNRHERKHIGGKQNKNFKCNKCGKAYYERRHLLHHEKKHNTKKKFRLVVKMNKNPDQSSSSESDLPSDLESVSSISSSDSN